MAEFLLLFRGAASGHGPKLSPEEMQAQMERWMQWLGDLTKDGKMLGAQPLEATGKVLRGTKKILVDGPFAEGKEIVGGYLLCKAESIDEAIAIAKGCPILEHDQGSVEVRPVGKM